MSHTKRLHHLSFNTERIDTFTPRIPRQRMRGENTRVPRVCVADTLAHCLAANPYVPDVFTEDGYLERHELTMHECEHPEKGRVYGVPFVLYAFDAPSDALLGPDALLSDVPDAHATQEHWVTKTIRPVAVRFFLLYDSDATGQADYDELDETVFRACVPVDLEGAPLPHPFDERPFSSVASDAAFD